MTLIEELTPFFTQNLHAYPPFHPEILQFCEELSKLLFNESKHQPDIIALAFWLRRSHLNHMRQSFLERKGSLVPRGIVFHIPPSNIDVILVYSWITSLLVGNANIIRMPTMGNLRMELIFDLLKKYPTIEKLNTFIRYGHERDITEWICKRVDARIIWGGDETIAQIRTIPLQPHAIDLAFPNRFSFSAIHAEQYMEANKEEVAIHFFNDTFWFDQSACSSPRLIFWVGPCREASKIFYEKLQETIEQRRFKISTGGALLKKTYLFSQSLVLPVEKVLQSSNELSVMFLENPDSRCRVHCGQGLLYHIPIKDLDEIVPFVNHHDQTMTYYGFSTDELQALAATLNGKGISRFVPFGQALNFEPVWDGIDLFSELTLHQVIT